MASLYEGPRVISRAGQTISSASPRKASTFWTESVDRNPEAINSEAMLYDAVDGAALPIGGDSTSRKLRPKR